MLNLGKYERQYWQGVTFGETKDKPLTEQALYEYLAFILKLYGAQPVAGMAHLHGKKGKAMVHIGAVDAPVTIAEIDAAVDECAKLKQGELHVLGWEWEMGLYDLMVEAAKKKGVKLLLLQIPREVMEQQAAAKGDVRFFELAYLEAEIKQPKKLTAQVALKDFVIPNTELIPEDVRSKVKKWSDYIDYWAVDWDFQNDTFMQGWVAYRTRKERKLPLDLRPAHLREAGQVPHPRQGDRHLRQRHLAGLRRGGEVAMAKAVIAYDKDLPEIPGRRPWEKPTSYPGEGRRGADGLAGGRRPAAARAGCCWSRRSAPRWMPGATAGYPGASDVTRRLFEYWFEEDHEVAGFPVPFRYYFCQREAIETLVWLVEIAGQRDAQKLIQAYADDLQEGPALRQHRVPDHDGRPAADPPLRAGAGRRGRAGPAARGPAPLRLQDGHRLGQDLGHGDGGRLVPLPQEARARLGAVHELPDRRAERHRLPAAGEGLRQQPHLLRAAARSRPSGAARSRRR